MSNFRVDASEFEEWVNLTRAKYETMVLTLVDIASLIQANTNQLVPLDTGRLEESYNWKVREDNSNMIVVDIEYDAEDPVSGFHYAEYQHNHILNHPKRGTDHYLYKGIQASKSMAYSIIETDYLSLFGWTRGVY